MPRRPSSDKLIWKFATICLLVHFIYMIPEFKPMLACCMIILAALT